MSHNKNHDSQQLPVGRLGIISPYSCAELGTKVDNYLVSWRKKRHNEGVLYEGYDRDTYLIGSDLPRFGSGEAKGILKESVRGDDIYILVDVCNYSLTYSLAGQTNHMSPDDHYQNLKRIIAAIAGKARRINVIMPFLYESRQHRRTGRESLDCALALQELIEMGVENIITFDAHDPRIQNAIPLHGFETVQSAYQFIKNLLKKEKDLKLDNDTINKAKTLVHWQGTRITPDKHSIRVVMSRMEPDLFDDLLSLKMCLAEPDLKTGEPRPETGEELELIARLAEEIRCRGDCISLKTLAVSGHDIMEAGVKPGKEVGAALAGLLELVLEDPKRNTREILLQYLGSGQ